MWLFLTLASVAMQYVIVVFLDHTHLLVKLFLCADKMLFVYGSCDMKL